MSSPSLGRLYAKAVLTGFRRRGGALPTASVTSTGVRVSRARLAVYNKVCGLRLTSQLPVTYPHVLAFPLQVELMTSPDFPFPLAGSVHVANRITQHRPLELGDDLDLRVWATNLRDHPRGKQFDMMSSVSLGGDEVWTSVSTYLRRGAGSGSGSSSSPAFELPPEAGTWRIPADTGRRYAAVSGDRNPIHLYPLTARMFGFPRAIAHGMWTKARCLAAFEGRLPSSFTVDVRFRQPVLLPGRARFHSAFGQEGWRFALTNRDKLHLTGTIR